MSSMSKTSKKLSADDSRAVDLALDHSQPTMSGFTSMAATVPQDRLTAAERVLSLLDLLDAPEPAEDLVARTMTRIQMATAKPAHADESAGAVTQMLSRQPPVA